jgi:hypothetical protein
MIPNRLAGIQGGAGPTIAAMSSLILCAAFAGCTPAPLNQQSKALSVALAPVIDESTEAYRDTNAVHNMREDYEAVVAYQNKDSTYNPRSTTELLTDNDVQTRLAVLSALQIYSRSLVEITNGKSSPELDAAAASAGNDLTSLGNDLAPSIDRLLGIAGPAAVTTTTVTTASPGTTTSESTTSSATLSPQVRNGISAGVNALGQFLVNRKIEKELPAKIEAMDPNVQTLCRALADDAQTMQNLEGRDYDRILDLEKQFILEDQKSGTNANPELLRAEIMKLPEIARRQREANQRLDGLHAALVNLALTHHAVAAEAQQNNPEGLKEKLSELAAAGKNLGNFYSSLPAQ